MTSHPTWEAFLSAFVSLIAAHSLLQFIWLCLGLTLLVSEMTTNEPTVSQAWCHLLGRRKKAGTSSLWNVWCLSALKDLRCIYLWGWKDPPPHTGGPIVQCDFHPAGIPATASWKSAYPVALAICRSRWYLPWKREGIMENSWGLSPRRGQESLWVKGTLETPRCIRSPQLQ